MATFERIKEKAQNDKMRMPTLNQISTLLHHYCIAHTLHSSTNVVEFRSKGNRYVNSRHNGKQGKKLTIRLSSEDEKKAGWFNLEMDTSDSYYSFNTQTYARKLLSLIESKLKTK